MAFRLDRRSPLPYPAQVQRQAVAQVVAGRLLSGDRLPSVRQLAQQLRISRTTAERIQEALSDTMLVEVRPRSGAYVGSFDPLSHARGSGLERAHAVHEFLRETLERARQLGLDAARFGRLVSILQEQGDASAEHRTVPLPLVATPDAFECMARCLPDGFPARFLHIHPNASAAELPRRTRYVLCGYYLRARAQRIAESLGCKVLYVRYNVRLLNESMAIPPREHRHFVTRDPDNAETTRVFLVSAYPEVPSHRYTVASVKEWLSDRRAVEGGGQVWATVTAAPFLEGVVEPARVRVNHPVLAEDFIDELRSLALFA